MEVSVVKCCVMGGFHVGRVSRDEVIDIIGGVVNLRGSTTTSSTLVSPAGTGAASGPVVKKTSASILVRGRHVVHGPALGKPSAGRGQYSGGRRSCWHPVSLQDNLRSLNLWNGPPRRCGPSHRSCPDQSGNTGLLRPEKFLGKRAGPAGKFSQISMGHTGIIYYFTRVCSRLGLSPACFASLGTCPAELTV